MVQALREGVQTVLMRKGGLQDEEGSFKLVRDEFFLFPTYEHQKVERLAPRYRRFLSAGPSDPSSIYVDTYARVIEVHALRRASHLEPFSHLHILSPDYLEERFLARPEEPLWLILVQTYRLQQPLSIPNEREYGGCRSWVTLRQEISTRAVKSVLSEERLAEVRQSVQTIVSALPRA